MRVHVEIVGLDKALAKIDRYDAEVARKVKQAVAGSALNLQRGAKKRCPVDTGTLRNSIVVDFYQDKLTAEVEARMPYAPFVEHGTRFMRAQPFMFPAWEEERPKFEDAIREAVKPN